MGIAVPDTSSLLSRMQKWHTGWAPSASMFGVWFAVLLHLTWAGMLLFSDKPKNATAVHALARVWPAKVGLATVLVVVAGCATFAILKKDVPIHYRVALLIPQQIVLGISTAGAIWAMWVGHFADGVQRPTEFLIADQAPAALALIIHSATILYLAASGRWGARWE